MMSLFWGSCVDINPGQRSGQTVINKVVDSGKSNPPIADTNATCPAPEKETNEDEHYEYPYFNPKKIDPGFLAKRELIITGNFRPGEALRKLFPGRYYKVHGLYDKTPMELVAWRCPICPKKVFGDWIGYTDTFPLTRNCTRYGNMLKFRDDSGRENIIMSFSTVELDDPLVMTCGRFTCAFLGLAWFMADSNQWELRAFTPVIGCYGAFQHLPEIKRVRFGWNNFGCRILDGNGGGGGPYYYNLYVFGIINDSFKMVLDESGVRRSNRPIAIWDMKFSDVDNTDTGFGDLGIILKGDYDKAMYEADEEDPLNTPVELHKKIRVCDSFGFRIARTYHFGNGKYNCMKSKVKIN